ncbi:hypothetical protein CAG99_10360 [Streptomyces marincola]|uniref:Uncharacterized protein n=1 Tax=Streptomyces marincola TaxID=2878388 RepID=A0A1W7CWL7_9ACTN|nr:hypothetical protein CAG99_10360 [Streptomyces marincola]
MCALVLVTVAIVGFTRLLTAMGFPVNPDLNDAGLRAVFAGVAVCMSIGAYESGKFEGMFGVDRREVRETTEAATRALDGRSILDSRLEGEPPVGQGRYRSAVWSAVREATPSMNRPMDADHTDRERYTVTTDDGKHPHCITVTSEIVRVEEDTIVPYALEYLTASWENGPC